MTTATTTTDDAVLVLIDHLDRLWSNSDQLAAVGNDDSPEGDAICKECAELERVILVSPVWTEAGLAGKRRIVDRAELTEWDTLGLVGIIFAQDEARIAAA